MILGPRRAILIAVIVGVAAFIVLLPVIFSLTAPNLEDVQVRFSNVTMTEAGDEEISLKTIFTFENPTDITATTSIIDYELFADGKSLGTRTLSYENVPIVGRPPIFAQSTKEIPDTFILKYNEDIADLYNMIKDNPSNITWRASGTAQIESSLTFVTESFDNEI